MKRILLFLLISSRVVHAQSGTDDITVSEATRIENVLASDEMRGRRAGSPDIAKAAAFIAVEFKKAGLQPLQGNSFLQPFTMMRPKLKELSYKADGADMDTKKVFVITTQPELEVTETSGYEVRTIKAGGKLFTEASALNKEKKNLVVLVDPSYEPDFSRLSVFKRQMFQVPYSKVFLLTSALPKTFSVKAGHSFEETHFANVVGVLPGKSKAAEDVVFSGHYDHLGVGRPVGTDSVYNGANDDAAGTTAVILLAKHFKKAGNNERSLVFAAFTAEEIGGFGSQYFSQQMNPDDVVAMFNIEMIGTESKWGRNSAYITGFEKSNMGEILQKNLEGTAFQFYPDPYPDQQLFYRSDNATLARLGVPAHTLSTSKMDSEPNYHKPGDEVSTLDLDNMAAIIKAIAESSRTIVSGKDTPARVKTENLM